MERIINASVRLLKLENDIDDIERILNNQIFFDRKRALEIIENHKRHDEKVAVYYNIFLSFFDFNSQSEKDVRHLLQDISKILTVEYLEESMKMNKTL